MACSAQVAAMRCCRLRQALRIGQTTYFAVAGNALAQPLARPAQKPGVHSALGRFVPDQGDFAQAEPEPAVLGIEEGQALDAADHHLERNAIRINQQAH